MTDALTPSPAAPHSRRVPVPLLITSGVAVLMLLLFVTAAVLLILIQTTASSDRVTAAAQIKSLRSQVSSTRTTAEAASSSLESCSLAYQQLSKVYDEQLTISGDFGSLMSQYIGGDVSVYALPSLIDPLTARTKTAGEEAKAIDNSACDSGS